MKMMDFVLNQEWWILEGNGVESCRHAEPAAAGADRY